MYVTGTGGTAPTTPVTLTGDVIIANATGTPSASTYLRGDGSCSTPSGGGSSFAIPTWAAGTRHAVGQLVLDGTPARP